MSKLIINETEDTPSVFIDNEKGTFEFSGNSFPENAQLFYLPIKNWVKDYVLNPAEVTKISLKFDYLNTASTKYLLEILMMFLEINDKSKKLEIIWYCQITDEDMNYIGKKFKMLTELPIEIIRY
jgi:hypothetical protein